MKVLICDDDKYIADEIQKSKLTEFTDKHKIYFDIDVFLQRRRSYEKRCQL